MIKNLVYNLKLNIQISVIIFKRLCKMGTNEKNKDKESGDLYYAIDENPPWYLSLFIAFQHFLSLFGLTILMPLFVAESLCINDDHIRGYLVCLMFFITGISSFLQVTFGSRLPMVECPVVLFFVALVPILNIEIKPCDNIFNSSQIKPNNTEDPLWRTQLRELQGAVIIGGLLQMVICMTGIIGFLLKYITPIAITPSLTLLGLSLMHHVLKTASTHWGISLMTLCIAIIFSQYMKDIHVPCLKFKKGRGCYVTKFPLFKMFSVLLAMFIGWIICAILTITEVFPKDKYSGYGYLARTDIRINVIEKSSWFHLPYPGYLGSPIFKISTIVGVIPGIIASIIDSIGEYYACARVSNVPQPPQHAINRGLAIEGIACSISGLWGFPMGVSTIGGNIGLIAISRVASRRVIQYASVILIILGLFGKFGAVFVTLPEPVLGGVICLSFSMITGIGISNLQKVDVTSPRNVFIIGFSIFMGYIIPEWLNANVGIIKTGSSTVDDILRGLLSSHMFLGLLFGLLFDNTLKGTAKERGLFEDSEDVELNTASLRSRHLDVYNLPFAGRFSFYSWSLFKYCPVCPSFDIKLQCLKYFKLRRRSSTIHSPVNVMNKMLQWDSQKMAAKVTAV